MNSATKSGTETHFLLELLQNVDDCRLHGNPEQKLGLRV